MDRIYRKCRVCDVSLIIGNNITQHQLDNYQYVCRDCARETQRDQKCEYRRTHRAERLDWYHRTGRSTAMSENRECTAFLGVHAAERVLSYVFKDVERMPYGTKGYDFICNRGKKIDVKSSCRYINKNKTDYWQFRIKKNQIVDYFLCLAFDNRRGINPEHIWMIPAKILNQLVSASISETTLDKWAEYELNISKVSMCCDVLKGVY